MDAIFLLIPLALILVIVTVAIFFWAVKSDQFDDLEGPAHSILFDDDKIIIAKQANAPKKVAPSSNNDSDNASKEH